MQCDYNAKMWNKLDPLLNSFKEMTILSDVFSSFYYLSWTEDITYFRMALSVNQRL